jgi:hypothetical protein
MSPSYRVASKGDDSPRDARFAALTAQNSQEVFTGAASRHPFPLVVGLVHQFSRRWYFAGDQRDFRANLRRHLGLARRARPKPGRPATCSIKSPSIQRRLGSLTSFSPSRSPIFPVIWGKISPDGLTAFYEISFSNAFGAGLSGRTNDDL